MHLTSAWNMEHGTGNMEQGTWNMEQGTWNMEQGTWNMEHGTWNMEHGTNWIATEIKVTVTSHPDYKISLLTYRNRLV